MVLDLGLEDKSFDFLVSYHNQLITIEGEIFTVKKILRMHQIAERFHAKFITLQIITETNINYGSEQVYIFLHVH